VDLHTCHLFVIFIESILLRQETARDEGHILLRLQKLEKRLEEKLHDVDSKVDKRFDTMDSKIDLRLDAMESRLDKIADAVGVNKVVSQGDDDEDRKRLKERLNEALGDKRYVKRSKNEVEGWKEYLFGICKPNGRLGKHGSRSVKTTMSRGVSNGQGPIHGGRPCLPAHTNFDS
jgi:hypothetical protein